MNQNTLKQLITMMCSNKIFLPMVLVGHGTHGNQWLATIRFFLEIAFGELAEKLPVAYIGFDSASNSKNHTVSIPGFSPYTTPAGLIRTFESFSIDALKESCGASKATHGLSRKLDAIPQKDASTDGCSQYRSWGASVFAANLQQMRTGWEDALKLIRDEDRIQACRAAGITILDSPPHALRYVNTAGTTAQSVDIPHALLGKVVAWETYGRRLTNSLLAVLPSASSATNRNAMRNNAAAYLLEAAMAKVHPEYVSVGCLDGTVLKHDRSIYDNICPLGTVNEYQAVTNRDAVTCRHAILALLLLTTSFVPWAAQEFANTLRDQQDRRFGPLICRNIGWTRHFTSPEMRREVMKAAALNHLRQTI